MSDIGIGDAGIDDFGKTPSALCIGVTGHRTYLDPDQVQACVDAVLDRLWPALDAADAASVVVVSSLAEGADR
ncbi:MAG TPA: hypothetical protein PLV68_02215, partial [Ilumatobacteraceae bacterium]|nr:hypothetical protein [Ilumatobacteraceae bacterium]